MNWLVRALNVARPILTVLCAVVLPFSCWCDEDILEDDDDHLDFMRKSTLDYLNRPMGDEDSLEPDHSKTNSIVNGIQYDSPSAEIVALIRHIAENAKILDCFVKLEKPFFGFPWLKIKTEGNRDIVFECAMEMTFDACAASNIPLQRIKALQDWMSHERGLEVVRQQETGDDYSALARSKYVKYRFYLHTEASKRSSGGKRYTLGFLAKRILGKYEDRSRGYAYDYWDWEDVVHETIVDCPDNEDAWRYVIEQGKSSEELLDEWIATGNRNCVVSGHSELGMCIGVNNLDFTACTEAEAEVFLPFCGCYARSVDNRQMRFLFQKLINPQCFRVGRTEPVNCSIGNIFWKVIPGDTVEWYEAKKRRRVGTVVKEGEGGVYWDPIKAYVKVTVDEELAAKEDWAPTEATKQYEKWRFEVWNKIRDFEGRMKSEDDLRDALSFFASKMQPGYFNSPYLDNVDDGAVPTKEYVRKKVLARECRAYNDWQYELIGARREILDYYFGIHRNCPAKARPDAETAKRIGLTREEDYYLRALPGWDSLEQRLHMKYGLRDDINTGFRVVGECKALPTEREVDELVAKLREMSEKKEEVRYWRDEHLLPVCHALETVLENDDTPAMKRLCQAAIDAVLTHPSEYRIGTLCKKICLEYGEDRRAWAILSQICKGADANLAKIIDAMFASAWHKYAMARDCAESK